MKIKANFNPDIYKSSITTESKKLTHIFVVLMNCTHEGSLVHKWANDAPGKRQKLGNKART